ncbi:unnamed protein product [Protopolystoma xenopodis]|uniref:Uncharacterized protein n=1 Tax=Protopolystoma xenopodis TaxID=117903 RepID=A0A3S5AED3_9PLAT|nr:unnamed protein product [Protopolystoma xenopodis]
MGQIDVVGHSTLVCGTEKGHESCYSSGAIRPNARGWQESAALSLTSSASLDGRGCAWRGFCFIYLFTGLKVQNLPVSIGFRSMH